MVETLDLDATEVDPRIVRTRERAIDAAVGLLTESGLASCTMQTIAKRAQVARSTLYRHWPDPVDLIVEGLERIAKPPATPGPDTGSLREDLWELAQSLAEALTATPWGRVAPQLVGGTAVNEAMAAVLERFVEARTAVASEVLDRARRRGELAAGYSDIDVLTLLMGPIYYRFLVLRRPVEKDWVTVHAERVQRLVADASGSAEHVGESM